MMYFNSRLSRLLLDSHTIKTLIRSLSLKNCNLLTQTNRLTTCYFYHTSSGSFSYKVVPFYLADIGEGITEVVIKEWFIKLGEKVQQFDSICEVQTDKSSVTITSRYDGTVEKIYYQVDDIAKVGQPLVDIKIKNDDSIDQVDQVYDLDANHDLNHDLNHPNYEFDFKNAKLLAIPSVRRIAKENHINLADVKGTGKDGRVLKEDILAHIKKLKKNKMSEDSPSMQEKLALKSNINHVYKPVELKNQDVTVPLKGIQKAMYKSMKTTLKVPHFGYSDELDLTKLNEMVEKLRQKTKDLQIKITFMPFFIKTLSLALKNYPILNSSIDDEKEMIIYKPSHNIGFALNTKEGLIVPNIKNVQNLTILEVAMELDRIKNLTCKNELKTFDITDGTITLSNIGSIGGSFGIPIILPPEVAIVAIGKKKILPRFDENGNIKKAHIVNFVWSADHRIIDGATISHFSQKWKSYLEDPFDLIWDMK